MKTAVSKSVRHTVMAKAIAWTANACVLQASEVKTAAS